MSACVFVEFTQTVTVYGRWVGLSRPLACNIHSPQQLLALGLTQNRSTQHASTSSSRYTARRRFHQVPDNSVGRRMAVRRSLQLLLVAGVCLLLNVCSIELRAYVYRNQPGTLAADAVASAEPPLPLSQPPPFPPPPAPLFHANAVVHEQGALGRRTRFPPPSGSPPLLFMMRTNDAEQCAAVGGVHQNGRSCKLPCIPEMTSPPLEASTVSVQPPRWQEAAGEPSTNFTGGLSVAARTHQLQACGAPDAAPLACGFVAPSVWSRPRALAYPTAHKHMTV